MDCRRRVASWRLTDTTAPNSSTTLNRRSTSAKRPLTLPGSAAAQAAQRLSSVQAAWLSRSFFSRSSSFCKSHYRARKPRGRCGRCPRHGNRPWAEIASLLRAASHARPIFLKRLICCCEFLSLTCVEMRQNPSCVSGQVANRPMRLNHCRALREGRPSRSQVALWRSRL